MDAVRSVSLVRLYGLRACYLVMAVGLGIFIWPAVIDHSDQLATTGGVRIALLAGLGATALLGVRYPLQMLPLMLFELLWKAIYLAAFAFPLWHSHRMNDVVAEDIKACMFAVIFIPLIPWGYVFQHYVKAPAERWR